MTDPIIPTPDEVLRPAVETLTSLRPQALKYINTGTGNWSAVIAGWRSQVALMLARLADAAASCRLNLASGQDLRDLIQSEYAPLPDLAPAKAIGSVALVRTGTAQGVIKKGTRFVRKPVVADTPLNPAVQGATYESTKDIFVNQGQTSVTVPFRCTAPGSFANQPLVTAFAAYSNMSIADTLFDPSFSVSVYQAAGGSDGFGDPELRAYARAYASGQFAPTNGALIAGTLATAGVKRVALKDQGTGTAYLYPADASWASSNQWVAAVKQSLFTNKWVGFGCSVDVRNVINLPVGITCTVKLADHDAIFDTTEIDNAIIAAVRSYFDDRPDWYLWSVPALRAVVARAHSKILACPTLAVVDQTNTPMTPPSFSDAVPYHYRMTNSLTASYIYPA